MLVRRWDIEPSVGSLLGLAEFGYDPRKWRPVDWLLAARLGRPDAGWTGNCRSWFEADREGAAGRLPRRPSESVEARAPPGRLRRGRNARAVRSRRSACEDIAAIDTAVAPLPVNVLQARPPGSTSPTSLRSACAASAAAPALPARRGPPSSVPHGCSRGRGASGLEGADVGRRAEWALRRSRPLRFLAHRSPGTARVRASRPGQPCHADWPPSSQRRVILAPAFPVVAFTSWGLREGGVPRSAGPPRAVLARRVSSECSRGPERSTHATCHRSLAP